MILCVKLCEFLETPQLNGTSYGQSEAKLNLKFRKFNDYRKHRLEEISN